MSHLLQWTYSWTHHVTSHHLFCFVPICPSVSLKLSETHVWMMPHDIFLFRNGHSISHLRKFPELTYVMVYTRVYYWEQTTWRSTLEQRKFCDVAVAQSLQTEEAGLVQPACQMVFYTWEPCAKLPLVNILKNVCAFKIYLAGDWTNHLYTNIYHGLTSTNHTVGECYDQLHQVEQRRAKMSFQCLY